MIRVAVQIAAALILALVVLSMATSPDRATNDLPVVPATAPCTPPCPAVTYQLEGP